MSDADKVSITRAVARCGSVSHPARDFEGTFILHGHADSLEQVRHLIERAPRMLEVVRVIAELKILTGFRPEFAEAITESRKLVKEIECFAQSAEES